MNEEIAYRRRGVPIPHTVLSPLHWDRAVQSAHVYISGLMADQGVTWWNMPGRLSASPGASTSKYAAESASIEEDNQKLAECLAALHLCGPLIHEHVWLIVVEATGVDEDAIPKGTISGRCNNLQSLGAIQRHGRSVTSWAGKPAGTWMDSRTAGEEMKRLALAGEVDVMAAKLKYDTDRLVAQLLLPIKRRFRLLELDDLRQETVDALMGEERYGSDSRFDEFGEEDYRELKWNIIELRRKFTEQGWEWPEDPPSSMVMP